MTNGMMLQIAAGTTPDHGKDSETILLLIKMEMKR